jgi:hypothetical protein
MRLGQRLGRRISSLPFGKKDSAANTISPSHIVGLFGKSILALRLSVGNMSPSLAVECQR